MHWSRNGLLTWPYPDAKGDLGNSMGIPTRFNHEIGRLGLMTAVIPIRGWDQNQPADGVFTSWEWEEYVCFLICDAFLEHLPS